jgi:hypothetical protein
MLYELESEKTLPIEQRFRIYARRFSSGGSAGTSSAAARVPAAASLGSAPIDLPIGPRRCARMPSANSPRAIRKRGRCARRWKK